MPAIKFLSPFLIFIFFTLNLSSETKIGFGSCLDQRYPQKIWKSIADENIKKFIFLGDNVCLLYTSPSPRDKSSSRMPSSA